MLEKVKNFKQLVSTLHTKEPNPLYWRTLVLNSSIVLLEIEMRNQGVVAKDLKMTASKLSNIVSLLREHALGDSHDEI